MTISVLPASVFGLEISTSTVSETNHVSEKVVYDAGVVLLKEHSRTSLVNQNSNRDSEVANVIDTFFNITKPTLNGTPIMSTQETPSSTQKNTATTTFLGSTKSTVSHTDAPSNRQPKILEPLKIAKNTILNLSKKKSNINILNDTSYIRSTTEIVSGNDYPSDDGLEVTTKRILITLASMFGFSGVLLTSGKTKTVLSVLKFA